MPRNRRDNNETGNLKPQDVEEDYLDVDKPLPGQNYYCISFVSPEKVLEQKELFMYYHYERAFYKKNRPCRMQRMLYTRQPLHPKNSG